MHWLRRIWHKARSEKELDAELRFHLDRQIADNLAVGMSAQEARRQALLTLGGLERVKEEVRAAHWETRLENLLRDFHYAFRSLRKDYRFAATTILALSLGIGASTVIFSIIYNGLLRPFPYKNASRLMTFSIHDLQSPDAQGSGRGDRGGFTSAELLTFQQHRAAFEDLIGFMSEEVSFSNGQDTLQVHAARVTPNTFQSLGVEPLLGRSIIPEDASPGQTLVFAMNYRLWQQHFGGDPKIVGSRFSIGGANRTLVAIMPPRFQINPEGSELWIPTLPNLADSAIPMNAAEPMHLWWPVGHVREGLQTQAVSNDLNLIAQRLAKSFPELYPPRFAVVPQPFADVVVGNFRSTLYALMGAVAILLLITCTNVVNLLLARASTREKEIAVRLTVGATRARLIGQLLFENFLLALAGAVVGCLFAYWGLRGFLLMLPAGTLPAEAAINLNPTVLLFALAMTVFAALLSGVVPTVRSLRGDTWSRLATGNKGTGGHAQGQRLRSALVVAEVALSIVLLVGAGLMIRTLFALTRVDLGFQPSDMLVTEVSFPDGRSRTAQEKKVYFEQGFQRLASLPGVLEATTTASLPPYGGPGSDIELAGQASPAQASVRLDLCSTGFLRTIGLQLLRGRFLSPSEIASAQTVVVIDETFARSFFGESDPIGRKIKFKVLDLIPDAPHNAYFEIIGLVSSIKNRGLRDSPAPQAYLPYTTFATPRATILVRTSTDPRLLENSVHQAIRSVDTRVSLSDTAPLTTYLARFDYASPEFGITAFGAFAGIGLLLASLGIFGLMAYAVALQTHEIGIRLALGARQANILVMTTIKGMRLVLLGIAMGLFGSYFLTRLIASQVWGISPTDAWTFAGVALLVISSGLLACYIPARRASKLDPLVALRYE